MKKIIATEQRQVVPEDFSFLSEADLQINQGTYKMLCNIYGFDGTKPIVIQGLNLMISLNPNGSKSVKVEDGLLLMADGDIIEVEGLSVFMTSNSTTEDLILNSLSIEITEIDVSPSPVYDKNGSLNIYCHKEKRGTIRNWLPEAILPTPQSNRIILAYVDRVYCIDSRLSNLENRIVALENQLSE